MKVAEFSALLTGHLYLSCDIPVNLFGYRLTRPQDHSEARVINAMRNPNRESNPRLSSLWISSSTNCATAYSTTIFILVTFHANTVIVTCFCRKYVDIIYNEYNLPVCRPLFFWQKLCTGFRLNLVFAGQTVHIYLIMMLKFWLALGSAHRKIICFEMTVVEECQTGSRVTVVAASLNAYARARTHTHTKVRCADCHCWSLISNSFSISYY